MSTTEKRKLPGIAQRNSLGRIEFRRGNVIRANEYIQHVEMVDERNKLIVLIGETFLYWCAKCKISIWQFELDEQARKDEPAGCPFCHSGVFIVSEGDMVRLHYRMPDHLDHGSSAAWWAERYDWKNNGLQDQ